MIKPKTTIKYISDDQGTISTKEINATTAMMSAFNRIGTTWAGGSKSLMSDVLRDEWGFRGCVISDFNLYDYMSSDQGMRSGTDTQLTWKKAFSDTDSATARIALRKAFHNLFYMVTNSNAMQDVAPGTLITYKMSTWRICLLTVTILISIGIIWVVYRIKKHQNNPE